MMKRILFAFVFCMLAQAGPGSSGGTPYRSPIFDFSFRFPAGWEVKELGNRVSVTTSKYEDVYVYIDSNEDLISEGLSIEESTQILEAHLRTQGKSYQSAELNGMSGFVVQTEAVDQSESYYIWKSFVLEVHSKSSESTASDIEKITLSLNVDDALIDAIEEQQLDLVASLLQNGASPDATRADSQTALIVAIEQGADEIAQLLLQAGADISLANRNNESPLFFASIYARAKVAQELISQGADVNRLSTSNISPLLGATRHRHEVLIEILLRAGAQLQLSGDPAVYNALVYSLVNQLERIALLILQFQSPQLEFEDGSTPLFHAVNSGLVNVVRKMIQLGAVFDSESEAHNVLLAATDSKQPDLLLVLLQSTSEIPVKVANSLLQKTTQYCRADLISKWLEKGARPSFLAVKQGFTSCESPQVWNLLIENYQADSAQPRWKEDLLVLASQKRDKRKFEYLITKGASINERDSKGRILFESSFRYPYKNTLPWIKYLLSRGADPNARDTQGRNSVFVAVETIEDLEVIKHLVEAGADLHVVDQYQRNLLSLDSRHPEVFSFLLDQGVNVNQRSDRGFTSFYHVMSFNEELAIRVLDRGYDLTMMMPYLKPTNALSALIHRKKCQWQALSERLLVSEVDWNIGEVSPIRMTVEYCPQEEVYQNVKRLIEAGISVNGELDERAPLISAIGKIDRHGNSIFNRVVKLLLENGAEPNVYTDRGFSSLFHYISSYQIETGIVAKMLGLGAQVSYTRNSKTYLWYDEAWKRRLPQSAFMLLKNHLEPPDSWLEKYFEVLLKEDDPRLHDAVADFLDYYYSKFPPRDPSYTARQLETWVSRGGPEQIRYLDYFLEKNPETVDSVLGDLNYRDYHWASRSPQQFENYLLSLIERSDSPDYGNFFRLFLEFNKTVNFDFSSVLKKIKDKGFSEWSSDLLERLGAGLENNYPQTVAHLDFFLRETNLSTFEMRLEHIALIKEIELLRKIREKGFSLMLCGDFYDKDCLTPLLKKHYPAQTTKRLAQAFFGDRPEDFKKPLASQRETSIMAALLAHGNTRLIDFFIQLGLSIEDFPNGKSNLSLLKSPSEKCSHVCQKIRRQNVKHLYDLGYRPSGLRLEWVLDFVVREKWSVDWYKLLSELMQGVAHQDNPDIERFNNLVRISWTSSEFFLKHLDAYKAAGFQFVRHSDGKSAVERLVREDLDIVKAFVERGLPLSGFPFSEEIIHTWLWRVTSERDLMEHQVFTYLLKNGLTVNKRNNRGEIFIIEVAKKLIKSPAYAFGKDILFNLISEERVNLNPVDENGRNILHLLLRASRGREALVSKLIKQLHQSQRFSFAAQDASGQTPLMMALGKDDFFRELVKIGQGLNRRDLAGNTVLHRLAQWGARATSKITLVLEKGGRVNAVNLKRQTPLMFAAEINDEVLVKFLLDRGANKEKRDWEDKRAYDYAWKSEVKRLLR